ncbi:hypothetical protein IQ235_18250 [Oscillatoriales cyanobacterium LEGE 11467]|uniref:Filament integrity protein n=1 Tax=Zarconia navalis LEGE 11467 TaxID=1828826 RepID=A0A928W3V5_9CYAN|nr:filament integrity protein FraC [Zarconia navalis]MBE9042705.1 hypothetical protein [Zarconia navalis LEGE 11467]
MSSILPLKTILLQTLLLLVTIAIESWVLRNRLNLPRKLSIMYAAIVNLLSVSISWLAFFAVEPEFLPPTLKNQLIHYILIGRLSSSASQAFEFWAIVIGFAIFFVTLQVKVQALYLLQITGAIPSRMVQQDRVIQRHKRLIIRREQTLAILAAHGLSHSAMLVILVILNLQLLRV